MEALAIAAVLATIVAWCVLAGRLQPAGLTAPIVFVAAGWLFTEGIDLFDLDVEPELVTAGRRGHPGLGPLRRRLTGPARPVPARPGHCTPGCSVSACR